MKIPFLVGLFNLFPCKQLLIMDSFKKCKEVNLLGRAKVDANIATFSPGC